MHGQITSIQLANFLTCSKQHFVCTSIASILLHLRDWWSGLPSFGRHFGYHINAAKTWLVVTQGYLAQAQCIFDGTGIQIMSAGRPYLGAPLGLRTSSQTIHRIAYLSGFKVYLFCLHLLLRNSMLHLQFLCMAFCTNWTTTSGLLQTSMICCLL